MFLKYFQENFWIFKFSAYIEWKITKIRLRKITVTLTLLETKPLKLEG
jgi:hypothetical protein